jgi:hypothetical protein
MMDRLNPMLSEEFIDYIREELGRNSEQTLIITDENGKFLFPVYMNRENKLSTYATDPESPYLVDDRIFTEMATLSQGRPSTEVGYPEGHPEPFTGLEKYIEKYIEFICLPFETQKERIYSMSWKESRRASNDISRWYNPYES